MSDRHCARLNPPERATSGERTAPSNTNAGGGPFGVRRAWKYVWAVCIRLWPMRSMTERMSKPPARSHYTGAWRRSWKRTLQSTLPSVHGRARSSLESGAFGVTRLINRRTPGRNPFRHEPFSDIPNNSTTPGALTWLERAGGAILQFHGAERRSA
jgi:hypothetical protein